MKGFDEILLQKATTGDEQAFAVFYRSYYASLCGYAASIVVDRHVAGEMVDNVFVSLWTGNTELAWPPDAYLFRAIRNQCFKHLRNNRTGTRVLCTLTDEHIEIHIRIMSEDTVSEFAWAEVTHTELRIRALMDRLPKRNRLVLKLFLYKGLNVSEISEMLHISQSTVRVHLKNGTDFLRKQLNSESIEK